MPPETSRLLTLPREIRDIIWQYALHDPYIGFGISRAVFGADVSTKAVFIQWQESGGTVPSHDFHWGAESMSRFIGVNAQIRKEAAHALLTRFDFHIRFLPQCNGHERLLSHMPPCSRDLLQSLNIKASFKPTAFIYGDCYVPQCLYLVRETFLNLRQVCVEVHVWIVLKGKDSKEWERFRAAKQRFEDFTKNWAKDVKLKLNFDLPPHGNRVVMDNCVRWITQLAKEDNGLAEVRFGTIPWVMN